MGQFTYSNCSYTSDILCLHDGRGGGGRGAHDSESHLDGHTHTHTHTPVADLGEFLGFHGTPLWAGPITKRY